MSKKSSFMNKLFKNRTDGHGTQLANEEIQFRPAPTNGQDGGNPKRLSEVISKAKGKASTSSHPNKKKSDINPPILPRAGQGVPTKSQVLNDTEKTQNLNLQSKNDKILQNGNGFSNVTSDKRNNNNNKTKLSLSASADSALMKPQLMKVHTSPRCPRKLIKPGVPNAPQPNFTKSSKDVTIQDEYSDPFDALHDATNGKLSTTDKPTNGYVEPYDFRLVGGVIQTHDSSQNEHNDSADLYQDPWDKNMPPNSNLPQSNNAQKQEYEDPWDRSHIGTLPYATSQRNDKRLLPKNDSWGSGGSSSSSSPPVNARHRLICVNQRKHSPGSSPKFDHRLILPKDSDSRYSEPWARQNRPVDKRLVKAEPSLEELRRMSPRGSAGTSSPLSSGHGSPVGTLSAPQSSEDLTHNEVRRSSTPYINPRGPNPMPMSRLAASKNKSRSLDIRQQQQNLAAMRVAGRPEHNFPKSASDEQLVAMQLPVTMQLGNVGEYEEPWDRSEQISHSRSRSYELHHPQHLSQHHDSSDIYDRPWDKQQEFGTSVHLQSMQRFQQRRLELHPSEAFGTRDINTMRPLEHQSWYHGTISREEALSRLKNKPVGSFLVRVSESCRDNFTLSLQAPNGCVHMRMSRTRDRKWILGEFSKPFISVPEMVAFYQRNKLEVDKNITLSLQYPVDDSML